MNLVYHPNKILNTKLEDVNIEDPGFNPKELKEEMVDFMLQNNGVGLSANQIGADKRFFVMCDENRDQSILCMNPTILQYSNAAQVEYEGCLSFPNIWMKVNRPKDILVHFWDEDCVEQVFAMTGFNARVYLHEMDHTMGYTYKDKVSNAKWMMAQKKAKKIEKMIERSNA